VKHLLIGAAIVAILSIPIHSEVIADQGRPDLATIFNSNYQQYADHFGNVARTAFEPLTHPGG
jgi:hypothetical protein